MTRLPRAGRAPALLLTLATVAVAAVILALSVTGGSNAATPKPKAPAQQAAAHSVAPAAAKVTRAQQAAKQAAAHPGDSPAQMYIDDTEERRGQLIHTWDVCLLNHGATQDTTRAMVAFQGTGNPPLAVADPVPASASAACESKLPLLPKEENPSLNANYVADSEANVACLRAAGVDVHTVPDDSVYPDGLAWTYDTSTTKTLPNEGAVEKACEIKAFSSN